MPIARIGYGTDFILENQGVGIATDTTGVKLEVGGTTKANYNITGIASLTNYAGFANAEQNITGVTTVTGEHSTLGDIVVEVGSVLNVSTGATVCTGSVESISITGHFAPPCGGIEDREECPVEGTVRFNKDLNTLEFYNGVDWRQFTVNGASGRCLMMGGGGPATAHLKDITYVNIHTTGNSINFGELGVNVDGSAAVSSPTRAINLGGAFNDGSSSSTLNTMEYVTIASSGTAQDFGDLVQTVRYGYAATNGNRGILFGGTPGYSTTINAWNISSLGNAVDTGGEARAVSNGAQVYSPTRGIFVSGYVPSSPNIVNTTHYITITSNGDTTDFGSGIYHRSNSGVSNNVRGIIGGGRNPINVPDMYYITMASLGQFEDFGNLTVTRYGAGKGNGSSQTRGLFVAGYSSPTYVNTIDYVSFASLGNAIDFGDLTSKDSDGGNPYWLALASDCHGGLGGY